MWNCQCWAILTKRKGSASEEELTDELRIPVSLNCLEAVTLQTEIQANAIEDLGCTLTESMIKRRSYLQKYCHAFINYINQFSMVITSNCGL